MKKIILLAMVAVLYSSFAFAQPATINFSIKNATFRNCTLYARNNLFRYSGGRIFLSLDEKGHATHTLKITKPQFIDFYSNDSKSDQRLGYSFFVSPGDQLSFHADMQAKDNQVSVTGRGSINNQAFYDIYRRFDAQKFNGDTIPERVITVILKEEKKAKDELKKYIALHKPTVEFIRIQKLNLAYWAASNYYSFKENNRFTIGDAYDRNLNKWQLIQDSLFTAQQLDEPSALSAPNYTGLITTFLNRKKEQLWKEQGKNKTAFYKEWYDGDTTKGELEYAADMSNLLREKIINKYFKGKTAEYLYAHLIIDATETSDPKNIVNIYGRFKDKYPGSEYEATLKPIVNQIEKRQQQGLNARMVFADSTATQLNTLEDLLKLAKNKTVLVDMWGTWCSPCRQEIEKNSAGIKKHFKQKDLHYFYVANYDTRNTKSWKALIAYFNLEGTHVLASTALTDSIMKSVKGRGFPTYFVIKKDGSYALSKAGYPMDRRKLIEQLEEALNM